MDAAEERRCPTARSAASGSTSIASGRTSSTRSIEGPAPRPAARRRRWRRRRSRGRGAAAGGAAGGRRGGRGGGGGASNDAADRALSLRRRRRDVAQGEQRQPAADVLQPGAHRSERSRSRLPGRRRPAPDARRRQDDRTPTPRAPIHDDIHAIWIDPPTPNHVIIGNDGGLAHVVRPGEDVGLHAQPAGRALLPRELRHGDAVQRLRRHAGQLQLVRPERGARRGRHRQPRLDHVQGGDGFVVLQDPTRLARRLQRVAGRQHDPRRSRHRRDDDRSGRSRRRASRRCRWHWDTPIVLSPHDPKVALRRRQQGLQVARPRALVGRRSART